MGPGPGRAGRAYLGKLGKGALMRLLSAGTLSVLLLVISY